MKRSAARPGGTCAWFWADDSPSNKNGGLLVLTKKVVYLHPAFNQKLSNNEKLQKSQAAEAIGKHQPHSHHKTSATNQSENHKRFIGAGGLLDNSEGNAAGSETINKKVCRPGARAAAPKKRKIKNNE